MGTLREHQPRKQTWGCSIKQIMGFISKVLLMTICFLIYVAIFPIFFVLLTPLYIYRFLVILAQKLLKPNWVGIMSTRDALVGLDKISTRCECMITILLVMKGEANPDLIREVFQKEVIDGRNAKGQLSYLKLKYYFESWLGFTFWKKEEKFELKKHVREYKPVECNDPKSDFVTEEQLMKGLGSIATKPFPPGTSPWEALIVRKYKRTTPTLHKNVQSTIFVNPVDTETDKDVESALVLRIHHGIGDGYSILKIIMSNLCGDPLSVVPTAPVRELSPLTQLFQYIAIICLTPYYHFMQFFLNIDRTVWHLPSSKLKKEWQFTMTERLSFSAVKVTSKKFGVCVTATLLAGLAGGIHNFLKKKGKARQNKNIMRGLSPMPWKNHPMDTLVNHWTVGIFDIPVHKACPRERILSAHDSVDTLKKSPVLLTNFLTVPFLLGAPNWLTDFWGTNWMTTMIISNFPGPNFPNHAFYKTAYIDDVISWVPHMRGSAGLGVMLLSYNGGVRISLSVDKAIIQTQGELNELCYFIEEEFITLGSLEPTSDIVV